MCVGRRRVHRRIRGGMAAAVHVGLEADGGDALEPHDQVLQPVHEATRRRAGTVTLDAPAAGECGGPDLF
jgi:hypothetical protein